VPKSNNDKIVSADPRESIFPATQLKQLALEWKELHGSGANPEKAMAILEKITIASTPMFVCFAQFEGFHRAVDLNVLVSAAQERIPRWLIHWKPERGGLFTFFSKCAKNAFKSELVKVTQYRRRFFTTDDNLERVSGTVDPAIDQHDAIAEAHNRIREIQSRWGGEQITGTLRYILGCFEEVPDSGRHDRQAIILGAAFAFGLDPEYVKFFYTWSLTEVRNAMYGMVSLPLTEQDIFRSCFSHTLLPDLLNNIMLWDQMKKMIALYGGMKIKIPTLAQFVAAKDDYETFQRLEQTDLDPASVAKVLKKSGKSAERSAEEVWEKMLRVTDPHNLGEYPIYDTHDVQHRKRHDDS
jgi:hypothetical protein